MGSKVDDCSNKTWLLSWRSWRAQLLMWKSWGLGQFSAVRFPGKFGKKDLSTDDSKTVSAPKVADESDLSALFSLSCLDLCTLFLKQILRFLSRSSCHQTATRETVFGLGHCVWEEVEQRLLLFCAISRLFSVSSILRIFLLVLWRDLCKVQR